MYQYQFTNNAAGSNDECITFKALAVEPLYMREPNPTEPESLKQTLGRKISSYGMSL